MINSIVEIGCGGPGGMGGGGRVIKSNRRGVSKLSEQGVGGKMTAS